MLKHLISLLTILWTYQTDKYICRFDTASIYDVKQFRCQAIVYVTPHLFFYERHDG